MAASVCAKFVSKKVRKIRWKPRDSFNQLNSEYFVSGSWDDKDNDISLWHCPPYEESADPVLVSNATVPSDVNDIHFYDSSTFVTASGDGSILVFKIRDQNLEAVFQWDDVHHFKNSNTAPCTSIDCQSTDIASVGEDGRLNLMRVNLGKPHKIIDADSCSLNTVTFTSQNEILTGNSRGMLKLWDLRANSIKPVESTSIIEDAEVGISSVDRHPFQGHIVAIGSFDGGLTVFDLRKNLTPVTVLAGPESCLTEVRFHPDKADHLFTSSESGCLWHWSSLEGKLSMSNINVWLSGEQATNQLDIKEVLPQLPLAINSVDVSGEHLVCGGDNEAFYYIPKLAL